MSALEVNFFISKSLLLKYRYFLSCLLALTTWKDDVLLTFQQQQQAGGTSLPRTGRSLCGKERGKGAPSSWLTDPHLADPEGETLNGEVDKPAVSHLYLRPVWCCSGSLAGPLGVSISMELALCRLKGQPTGTSREPQISTGWDNSSDQRCQTWFLAISLGNRTSNQESVIFLSSNKMKMRIRRINKEFEETSASPTGNTNHCFHADASRRAEALQPGQVQTKLPSSHIACGPVASGWSNWKGSRSTNFGKNDCSPTSASTYCLRLYTHHVHFIRRKWGLTANGCGVHFWSEENGLKLWCWSYNSVIML